MRVVFLDFDGVLNSNAFLKNQVDCEQVDPSNVSHLNNITRETGAKVVVSSAWRCGRTIAQLRAILEQAGFEGEVVGKTPRLGGERGDEIMKWLETGTKEYDLVIENFVILDDDNDMGPMLPFLVRTSMKTGLTSFHAQEAIKRLQSSAMLL
jgi:hypothetical protein